MVTDQADAKPIGFFRSITTIRNDLRFGEYLAPYLSVLARYRLPASVATHRRSLETIDGRIFCTAELSRKGVGRQDRLECGVEDCVKATLSETDSNSRFDFRSKF